MQKPQGNGAGLHLNFMIHIPHTVPCSGRRFDEQLAIARNFTAVFAQAHHKFPIRVEIVIEQLFAAEHLQIQPRKGKGELHVEPFL